VDIAQIRQGIPLVGPDRDTARHLLLRADLSRAGRLWSGRPLDRGRHPVAKVLSRRADRGHRFTEMIMLTEPYDITIIKECNDRYLFPHVDLSLFSCIIGETFVVGEAGAASYHCNGLVSATLPGSESRASA